MTQEEKARAYDEALRYAMIYYKEGNEDMKMMMKTCFPVLVEENEDEKIRKEIIEYFENCNIKHLDWIAWLEKQGTSYTKRDVDDAYLKGVRDTKNEIEKQYEANYQIRKDIATFIFNYRGDIKDRAKWMDYLGIKVSFVEEQGEQKSADKVEPKFKVGDTIVEKDFDECGYGTIKDIKDGQYIFTDGSWMNIDEQGGWQLVKTSANVEQKPAEWHREDEQNLNACLGYIPDEFLRRWLSDVVHVKYDKPAWSEDDEKMFKSLKTLLNDASCYSCTEGVDKILSWLKSLRPQNQWKPSDEQMMALLYHCSNGSVLTSLYNNLKKLKEGNDRT